MATQNIAYGSWTTITISPASLASSSTHTAGRESTAVDNTSNLYDDALVAGQITTGTTPTAGTNIQIWVYAAINTSTYPDVFDGTDSAETVTSENVRNAALARAVVITVDSTSDRAYYVRPFSVAQLFGGRLPSKWGLFVAHNTAVNLNATAGNHAFRYLPITYTVA